MKDGYAVSGFAGLIAGFVTGLLGILLGLIYQVGVANFQIEFFLEMLSFTSIVHVGYNIIWGVVNGIIFSRFYYVIPGEGVKKGLVYGLILYLFSFLWISTYYLPRESYSMASIWLISGFTVAFVYGPLLGFLYRGVEQPVKIEDKIKHKPIAGVIAGFIGGIVAAVFTFIIIMIEMPSYWRPRFVEPWGFEYVTSISFELLLEIILLIIWGAIFSAIFVLFYARIPGKDIVKGLYFGCLVGLLSIVYNHSWSFVYSIRIDLVIIGIITYCLAFISYGLVLGYLYKKE